VSRKVNRLNATGALDLYSLSYLEVLLGRTRTELKDLARHAVRYYKPFPWKPKPRPFAKKTETAKKRWIDHPIDPLKAIQSRIQERLLSCLILPEHLLGGISGRGIIDNAKLHLQAPWLVTIDIKNFFPSIEPKQVQRVFRKLLHCSSDVAYLLTGLTTCRGRLPQGAPTSPLLANLVLSSFDSEIRAVCAENGVRYSSWIDDLAFSGTSAPNIIGPVLSVLMRSGFKVSHRKLRRMGPKDRKLLNKLVLGKFVTVQKQYRSRIRAGIHNLACGKVPSQTAEAYINGLSGRIIDPKKAETFRLKLWSASLACAEMIRN
jgi:RNA-directed DNA polymerase